jgi:hypothetical protein
LRSPSATEPPKATPRKVNSNDAGFAAFWESYPKKRSKGQAERAWTKIKPDGALLGRILEAVRVQSGSPDWRKEGGQFIPYPATWLNAQGWEDCVETAAATPEDKGKTAALRILREGGLLP